MTPVRELESITLSNNYNKGKHLFQSIQDFLYLYTL